MITFVRLCSRCGVAHARPGDVYPLTSAEATARLAECAERAAQPAYVHPKPEIPARVATADELAPVMRSVGARMRSAVEHGWEARALYVRGWEVKATRTHLATGALVEQIICQFGMAGEWRRAVATWSAPVTGGAWKFQLAYRWGSGLPLGALSAAGLADYLRGNE